MADHTIKLIDIAEQVVPNKRLLATRRYGSLFLQQLLRELQLKAMQSVVCLSFDGIDLMEASFADEVFGALTVARVQHTLNLPLFYLADIDETSLDNIRMALENRPDKVREATGERMRNCALPYLEEGRLFNVGKLENYLSTTFDYLWDRKDLSARQFAELLDKNVNTASSSLKTLADLGLARRTEIRDEQGRQYIYHCLV